MPARTGDPIRVFLADDHVMLRRGLAALLESTGDITVVGEANDGLAVLSAEAVERCDVVILDLSMPVLGGAEVMRRLLVRRPGLPVVILTMYPEEQHGLSLLRDGASAYLSKQRPPEDLIAAVRQVARGGRYVTETLVAQAVAQPRAAFGPPHERFSPREHQVFLLLLQGRSASEIAAELDLHASTVSNNLRRIKDKLGENTLAGLIRYAHEHGLCP